MLDLSERKLLVCVLQIQRQQFRLLIEEKMNEKRKQELQQLLQEALENLEIRPYGGFEGLSITPDQYKRHLQRVWSSYSENSLWIVQHFTIDIKGETRSKILEFIKVELDAFIHDDKILSALRFVVNRDVGGITRKDSQTDGDSLSGFLRQLLKIAIFGGIERAASDFEKCTSETDGSFQSIVLLQGIRSEDEFQVFDGIRLIPFSVYTSEPKLPRYLKGSINPYYGLYEGMMLVIDYSVSPIFHNPLLPKTTGTERKDKWDIQKERFQFKVKNREFSNFNEENFHEKICQSLSLACNSAVQFDGGWDYIAEEELFYINSSRTNHGAVRPSSADTMMIGKSEIDQVKRLYEKMVNPNSNVRNGLQIPINRWIKSKTYKDSIDKIIDLGIALEAIYLPKNTIDQLSFQFRLRASWHLGTDKEDREKLIDEFQAIYTLRSKAVHNGEVSEKIQIRKGEERIDTSEFILRAQDLCRQSIIKILEDGEFPDWNSLILGCVDI